MYNFKTMKYAVVKIGGNQYRVAEGDELLVDRLDIKEEKDFKIEKVLLTVDGDQVGIGIPLVEDASVLASVVSHAKGEKIRVAKFKAKSRYRKTRGFRAHLTLIKIGKISWKRVLTPVKK